VSISSSSAGNQPGSDQSDIRAPGQGGGSSAQDAPTATSWTFAEDFHPDSEAGALARRNGRSFNAVPVLPGVSAALTVLATVIKARAVVEIGSGAGVSGLALFAGMQPDGTLTSVDVESEHQRAARQAFELAGIAQRRFRLIAGDALTVLPKLSSQAYDLVLVDADKLEYPAYVEQALRMLHPGGLLVVDNALWHNRVADDNNTDDETEAVRTTLDAVRDNESLVSALLPVGDGLLVAVKG
jgi:predicted O-methyltransferase YrrM